MKQMNGNLNKLIVREILSRDSLGDESIVDSLIAKRRQDKTCNISKRLMQSIARRQLLMQNKRYRVKNASKTSDYVLQLHPKTSNSLIAQQQWRFREPDWRTLKNSLSDRQSA